MSLSALTQETATAAGLLAEASARLDAAGVDSPRLTAELLLSGALGVERAGLFTRLNQPVEAARRDRFLGWLTRRLDREPLQYIVGHQEFWSLDFLVTPDVLIPRPETELIVERALEAFPQGRSGARLRVCDVGTGSGCLAVTLAHEWPQARVLALDVSAAALRIATANAQRCGVVERIDFVQSDLFDALSEARFDLVVANPPYVSTADRPTLQPELAHEPTQAVFAGTDGLHVIRRLVAEMPSRLVSGGCLLMEIGADQSDAVLEIARRAGASTASVGRDYAGLPRLLCGRW